MALAIVLVLLLVGSIIFNFTSPWQATLVASNWGSIDTTIGITFVITGLFFVVITVFIAFALVKYRHRGYRHDGTHQAAYTPDSKKLEWGLTAITTVGICALLAPGLVVYGDFITVPKDADEVEVVAKQWMWSFRLPGKDGTFGKVGINYLAADNPFGLNPDDPAGQDDVLINSNELHLPINRPVKMLLRSLDVLHDFYVPPFRAKMDMVPGQVSYFWFTPTVAGSFEVLCAEYCGLAHYNMKGKVVVDAPEDYQSWLAQQTTFAKKISDGGVSSLVEQGRQLVESNGCSACHSIDGSKSLGPGWLGLWGSQEQLADGSSVIVDEAYFRESVIAPAAEIVAGYAPVMSPYTFSDEQLNALQAYVKTLVAGESGSVNAGATLSSSVSDEGDELIAAGKQLVSTMGCTACHSSDGSRIVGPTFKGLMGRSELLADGSTVLVDEAYIRESVANPSAQIVNSYPPVMQPFQLQEAQIQALLAYLNTLAGD